LIKPPNPRPGTEGSLKLLDVANNKKVGTTLTDFVGHSQGTINGNLAIDRMLKTEKQYVRVFNVGTASWHLPRDVASFTNVSDPHDLVTNLTFGRVISGSNYALEHPDTYMFVPTNIDGIPELQDAGQHHSFYLYAQTTEFQHAMGFKTVPTTITRPFPR
jgi:hypothetical protein